MWFLKKQFISFIEEEKIKTLCETVKKENIISYEEKEFETKKELETYIVEKNEDIPQTYISTIINTINQGVLNSCSKQKYLEKEIDYDNIKMICINNKYSFFVSLFDLNKLQKEYMFPLDFVYSPFSVIDYMAKERKNRFYIMVFEKYCAVLGYENFVPIYSDIVFFKQNEESEIEDVENIEDIDDIDILDDSIEDISEDIDDEIDETDTLEEKLNTLTTPKESQILEIIKNAIKEYYDEYSSDFVEKIVILDTLGIDIEITKIIEDEVLIECGYKKTEILKILNRISRESV